MVFSSLTFIYYFIPIVFTIYYLMPTIYTKNIVILLASLVFYAWGEPKLTYVIILSILNGYISGILIEKFKGTVKSKVVLIVSIGIDILMLGYFKYTGFILDIIGMENTLKIVLPLGISFYTFQILSYKADVYRGEVCAQKNPLLLGAYIMMFPQLIAGPIVRYKDINDQLIERTINSDKIVAGLERFIIGVSKKIILANTFGKLVEIMNTLPDKSVTSYWVYAIAFALQIYYDFSAYSDMAIGLGKMMGFDFLENFNYPYISKSITEFWRRWHMSLGSWFRDYVYIPLGGNRKHQYLNILVVWTLTGLWHGASWNFVFWGLLYGIALLIEKKFILNKHKQGIKVIGNIYTLLFVLIGFVLFDSLNTSILIERLSGMFMGGYGVVDGGLQLINSSVIYYINSYKVLLILGVMFSMPISKKINTIVNEKIPNKSVVQIIKTVGLAIILLVCTAYLIDDSFNPFIYFRF